MQVTLWVSWHISTRLIAYYYKVLNEIALKEFYQTKQNKQKLNF